MFTLTPEKTVGELLQEIQTVDYKAKKINLVELDGDPITLDTKFSEILTTSFWININKS